MNKKLLTNQIENILASVPGSRNSDIVLTIEIWKTYYRQFIYWKGITPFVELADLFELPREDNIKRIRAIIQNVQRRYLPTDPGILIERAKLSKEWKEFLGYREWWTDVDWNSSVGNFLKQNANPELF